MGLGDALNAVKGAITGDHGQEHRSTSSTTASCEKTFEAKGKAEPWEKAQDLTQQAEESARTAQIKVCDAQKTYENYTRANDAAKAASDRQAQLERELEAVRRSAHPGDIKAKQDQLERAKEEARRLGEERAKAQKNVEVARVEVERYQRSVGGADTGPVRERMARLEDELEKLRQSKRAAEGKKVSFAEEMRKVEETRGSKLSDVERLQHLLAQQEREVDEATQALKEARESRDRVSRELSEAKRAAEAAGQKLEYTQQHVSEAASALNKLSMKEDELVKKIQEARDEVARIQKEHQAREAELRKATEHYESLKKSAGPSAEQVVRAREAADAIDRDVAAIAKRAREAEARQAELEREYKLQGEKANKAGALAAEKMHAYEAKKTSAEQADAYKKDLWEKAKAAGNEGDQDAATRLAQMESKHEKKVEHTTTQHSTTQRTTEKVQQRVGGVGAAAKEE